MLATVMTLYCAAHRFQDSLMHRPDACKAEWRQSVLFLTTAFCCTITIRDILPGILNKVQPRLTHTHTDMAASLCVWNQNYELNAICFENMVCASLPTQLEEMEQFLCKCHISMELFSTIWLLETWMAVDSVKRIWSVFYLIFKCLTD